MGKYGKTSKTSNDPSRYIIGLFGESEIVSNKSNAMLCKNITLHKTDKAAKVYRFLYRKR